jgi:hypothetical protein
MTAARSAEGGAPIFDDSTGLENMRQLIQLRWIAVVGQIVTIAVVDFGFGIHLPLRQMFVVLICLVVFNLGSMLRWRAHHEVTNGELFFALLVVPEWWCYESLQLPVSNAGHPWRGSTPGLVSLDHGRDHQRLLHGPYAIL